MYAVEVGEREVGGRAVGHVRQAVRLHQAVGHVDAETVDPSVEPEPQDVLELCAHLGVAPVQVRLP
jgi:hypothetical protein